MSAGHTLGAADSLRAGGALSAGHTLGADRSLRARRTLGAARPLRAGDTLDTRPALCSKRALWSKRAQRSDCSLGPTGQRKSRAHDRIVEHGAALGTEETRVAEAEDATVGSDQPIAVARWRRDDPHDVVHVHTDLGQRAEQPGPPKREDPAVGADKPIPVAAGQGGACAELRGVQHAG